MTMDHPTSCFYRCHTTEGCWRHAADVILYDHHAEWQQIRLILRSLQIAVDIRFHHHPGAKKTPLRKTGAALCNYHSRCVWRTRKIKQQYRRTNARNAIPSSLIGQNRKAILLDFLSLVTRSVIAVTSSLSFFCANRILSFTG